MMRAGLVAAVLALGGCASGPVQPAPAETAAVIHEPAIRAFDQGAPPRIETSSFALELVAPSGASTAELSRISITIEGRGGFHVNLEYPVRIELGGSEGVILAKPTLAAADARELSEQRARFETQARWSRAGRSWVAARINFAVCTPDTCVPREEALALALEVR